MPGPRVPHLERDRVAAAPARADHHAALRRVAQRVGDEVAQDALQQHGVRAHREARRHDREPEVALDRLGREIVGEPVEQRIEEEGARLRGHRAGLQLGDVEERGKQRFERGHRRRDALRQRGILRIPHAVGQARCEEAERVQRLAQVVAGGGEEARLRAVGGLRGVARRAGLRELRVQRLALFRDALLEARVERLRTRSKHARSGR